MVFGFCMAVGAVVIEVMRACSIVIVAFWISSPDTTSTTLMSWMTMESLDAEAGTGAAGNGNVNIRITRRVIDPRPMSISLSALMGSLFESDCNIHIVSHVS